MTSATTQLSGFQIPAVPRRKPTPLPMVHPVPEYAAEGQRAAWYTDMKTAFQVPWMGVVTMAFSHYPTFFAELWRGLKPLAETRAFVATCADNRAYVEAAVDGLMPAALSDRLMALGYAPRELDNIRAMTEVFSHGNQPYVLTAAIARLLLEGYDMEGSTAEAEAFQGRHAPDPSVPFVLMEGHHADAPTREVYEDVKRVLGLPFVNTDYRALARWPSYWRLAWSDLKRVVSTPGYKIITDHIHARLIRQAHVDLPNPGRLTSDALRQAAAEDAPIEEILDVVRLFQWLLPGLTANIAFLRAHLLAEDPV